MTALIIAVFCGAALLAVASMVATAKHHVAAAIAILRQHQSAGSSSDIHGDPGHRKHQVYTRRLKPQPGWRTRAKARRAGCGLSRDGKLAAKIAMPARKSVHNRHYGFRLALLQDTLAFE